MANDDIVIPIMGGDGALDLINAFFLELHERGFIYISNGQEGEALGWSLQSIMKPYLQDKVA